MAIQVTEQHRQEYAEVGTVRIPGVLDRSRVDRLTQMIDGAIQGLRDGSFAPTTPADPAFRSIEFEDHDGYVRLVNLMPHLPQMRELILEAGLAEVLADVIGASDLRIWLDATFSKVGLAKETATPWHNDECTFALVGEHLPSLWIALTDVDEDNAPLITLAGSHKDEHRYFSTFFPSDVAMPENYRPWSELLDRVHAPDADIRVWTVNAGDILVIHPKTIHASRPRQGKEAGRRLAFTLRWIGNDVVYAPNHATRPLSPFSSDPRMVIGKPPPEEIFPIVWRATKGNVSV